MPRDWRRRRKTEPSCSGYPLFIRIKQIRQGRAIEGGEVEHRGEACLLVGGDVRFIFLKRLMCVGWVGRSIHAANACGEDSRDLRGLNSRWCTREVKLEASGRVSL